MQQLTIFFTEKRKPFPKTTDENKVDFKELGYIETVSEGDLLAQKTNVTNGEDGITVRGEVIKHKPGKDKRLLCGEGCCQIEDEVQVIAEYVIAEYDGIVKLENGKLSVSKYVEIDSDIGVETGNIKFCGQVVVNGNVTDGYTVECDGDLLINGFVEGAVLKSKGNIIVSKGIHGQWKASIHCDGNLSTTYINGASVNVKGDIDADYILNSMTRCDGKTYAHGRKGIIVGGEIISRSIEAQIVGSDLGVATIVRLGVSMEMLNAFRKLNEEVSVLMSMVNKLKQCLVLLGKRVEIDSSDTKSIGMLSEYGGKLQKKLNLELNDKEEALRILRNEIMIKKGELKAALIHSDTHVYIGTRKIVIKDDLVKSIVMKEQDEIKIKEAN